MFIKIFKQTWTNLDMLSTKNNYFFLQNATEKDGKLRLNDHFLKNSKCELWQKEIEYYTNYDNLFYMSTLYIIYIIHTDKTHRGS